MASWMTSVARALIETAVRGELDERQARQLAELGPEVVTLALLSASRHIAELQNVVPGSRSKSTPSGMIPIYAKANAAPRGSKRRKKPGAKIGHAGARRAPPSRIDRRLRAVLRAGIRLRKRPDFQPGKWPEQVDRLNRRLARLASEDYDDADARRLANRLSRHVESIFTFLDYADVPFDNNFAERQIRPAVIIRKNSLSNRSDRGAATQSLLMSVFRTLKLRGLDPIQTLANALRTYVATGKRPPLPPADIAGG